MLEKIIELICKGENYPAFEINKNCRDAKVVYTRQLIMFFACELNVASLKVIGARLGRDHATVIDACKVIQNYYDTEKLKQESIDNYRVQLTGIKKAIGMIKQLGIDLAPVKEEILQTQSRLINLQLTVQNIEDFIDKLNKFDNSK